MTTARDTLAAQNDHVTRLRLTQLLDKGLERRLILVLEAPEAFVVEADLSDEIRGEVVGEDLLPPFEAKVILK